MISRCLMEGNLHPAREDIIVVVVIVVIVFVVVVVIVICYRGMSFDRQICRSAANLLNSLISALSSMKRTKVSIFNEKVLAFNMLS